MKKLLFIIAFCVLAINNLKSQTITLSENNETFSFCSLSDIDTGAIQVQPVCMCNADASSLSFLKTFVANRANGSWTITGHSFSVPLTFNGGSITATYTFEFTKNDYILNPVMPMNDICMIAYNADSNAYEVIIDNSDISITDSFRIEKKIFNTWVHLATIPADSSKLMDDNSSFSSAQSYRVFTKDTCGFLRPLSINADSVSTYHSTMFLQYTAGDLIWSSYQVNEVDAGMADGFIGYYIYRGEPNQALAVYDSVSININQYTDLTPDTAETVYQIEAIKPSCDPFRSVLSTRSNKVELPSTASVETFEPTTEHRAWVYSGNLRFEAVEPMNVELYTIEGKKIYGANNVVSLTLPVEPNIIVCVVSDLQGRKSYKFVNVR